MVKHIELSRRFPTEKLARWELQFLPPCDWQVVARGKWFYLQFRCEADRAPRMLAYLRRDFPTLRFVENEASL